MSGQSGAPFACPPQKWRKLVFIGNWQQTRVCACLLVRSRWSNNMNLNNKSWLDARSLQLFAGAMLLLLCHSSSRAGYQRLFIEINSIYWHRHTIDMNENGGCSVWSPAKEVKIVNSESKLRAIERRNPSIDIERHRGTDNIFLTAIWGIICDNLLSAFASSSQQQMNANTQRAQLSEGNIERYWSSSWISVAKWWRVMHSRSRAHSLRFLIFIEWN